jgi:hypothetical protein
VPGTADGKQVFPDSLGHPLQMAENWQPIVPLDIMLRPFRIYPSDSYAGQPAADNQLNGEKMLAGDPFALEIIGGQRYLTSCHVLSLCGLRRSSTFMR